MRRGFPYCFLSFVHGDLNGANIIVDGQENVWLIDFFHTHRGHVLRDLCKLENDLLYIFTPLASEAELEQATRLSELLLSVEDLAAPLPAPRAYDRELPGRRDTGRSLPADLEALRRQGVSHVLCLLAPHELALYDVGRLLAEYSAAGFGLRHLPILDGGVPTPEELAAVLGWIEAALAGGGRVLVHCVGGLGRSGTIAACLLRSRGASAEEAIAAIRRARSPRAVETPAQEAFVRDSLSGAGGTAIKAVPYS